jgi:hypothetical protein
VYAEPVVLIGRFIDEQHGKIAEIVYNGFEATIVEQVGDGESTT